MVKYSNVTYFSLLLKKPFYINENIEIRSCVYNYYTSLLKLYIGRGWK